MGLGLRFNFILAACYLVGLGLCLWPFYQLSRREAIDQLQSQIDVLRAEALSVRRYTSEEVQPLLADQSAIQFLPQTIPAFSAQTVFRNFSNFYPQFFYKEAALNPTNPADLAKDWEQDVIERLTANPEIDKDISIRANEAGPQYTVAYPMVIKDESCMTCHSTPDKAPASMVALYGKQERLRLEAEPDHRRADHLDPDERHRRKVWRNLMFFVGISTGIFLVLLDSAERSAQALRDLARQPDGEDRGGLQHGRDLGLRVRICRRRRGGVAFPLLQPDAPQPRQRDENARQ